MRSVFFGRGGGHYISYLRYVITIGTKEMDLVVVPHANYPAPYSAKIFSNCLRINAFLCNCGNALLLVSKMAKNGQEDPKDLAMRN